MLPGDSSKGQIIYIPTSGDAKHVMLDNSGGVSTGDVCPKSPDSPSNNCRAKAEDYSDCKKEGGDCNDEREEAELACLLDTSPGTGNFSL